MGEFDVDSGRALLARLAVYYLTAQPPRVGLLLREARASFRVAGVDDAPLAPSHTRGDILAELRHRSELRLAGVEGNREVLRGRRADAVWLDVTDPERAVVEVHEIKTARGDLLAELRRPQKSAAWLQRAHHFWLTVAHAGLADDVEVPDSWGILALPFTAAPHVVRPAPLLTPTAPFPRVPLATYVARNRAGRYTVASRVRRG